MLSIILIFILLGIMILGSTVLIFINAIKKDIDKVSKASILCCIGMVTTAMMILLIAVNTQI